MIANRQAMKSFHRMVLALCNYFIFGTIFALTLSVFSAPVLADPGGRPDATKITYGWVCNAYELSGSWATITGTRKATMEAAKQYVLSECRKDYSACRLSGCWRE